MKSMKAMLARSLSAAKAAFPSARVYSNEATAAAIAASIICVW
jgi:hypothetical protein